jgi:hypothetical protein
VRSAPAVSVRCAGGRVWRLARVLLPAVAAGATAAWGLGHAGWSALPALGAALAAAMLAWRRTLPAPVALSWDGQCWAADGAPGHLDVMIDLGPWLLLRLRPQPSGSSRWIALTAREAGATLHALRAALYGHPPGVNPKLRPAAGPNG